MYAYKLMISFCLFLFLLTDCGAQFRHPHYFEDSDKAVFLFSFPEFCSYCSFTVCWLSRSAAQWVGRPRGRGEGEEDVLGWGWGGESAAAESRVRLYISWFAFVFHRVPGEIKRSRDLRGGRWSWTLNFAQKRSWVGRWSWAEQLGRLLLRVVQVVRQQRCNGHCLSDSVQHSSWKSNCTVHKSLGNGEGTPP